MAIDTKNNFVSDLVKTCTILQISINNYYANLSYFIMYWTGVYKIN